MTAVQTDDDDRDPWDAEAEAITAGMEGRDYDVANAADLPAELIGHAEAADADPDFEQQFAEWLEYLHDWHDCGLMLAMEQSCHEGILLPWDMRGRRLETLPDDLLARLHRVFDDCPRHVLVHLVHYVYWLVRSERARRRGSPDWSPNLAMPPPPIDDERDRAFRPMTSWPRHWP